jgi:hypothetical protein
MGRVQPLPPVAQLMSVTPYQAERSSGAAVERLLYLGHHLLDVVVVDRHASHNLLRSSQCLTMLPDATTVAEKLRRACEQMRD